MLKVFILFTFILLSCSPPKTRLSEMNEGDSLPKILTSGLGDLPIQNAQNTVGKKYGVSFLRVGGCVISNELSDSIRLHNETIYKNLEVLNGANWRNRLVEEIETFRELQYRVDFTLNHDTEIIKKNRKLEKGEYEMLYEIEFADKSNGLNIHAYDWDAVNGRFYKNIYYTISVDTTVNHAYK